MSMNKSQAWGSDLVIAMGIFSASLIFLYLYSFNISDDGSDILEKLDYEGNFISNIILSEGYPLNWTTENVIRIGVLDNGKINQTKLENFYTLNYQKTKALFNTKYNYYFTTESGFEIDNENKGIGNPNFEDSKNLIKITRFAVYQNKPITVYLYVFE